MDSAVPSTVDPITLQIQWSRLISVMDEVDIALVRTSFSTIVGETRDFAVVLLDRHARSIAQSQLSSPGFTCSLPSATRTMLKEFPAEELRPGDVLMTNDPWICHGHLPDFYIVVPVFCAGRLSAFIATAAHISDIGGRLDELDARDVYEEGLRIPPSKLYQAFEPNLQLFSILQANIRYPRMVIGDVEAIIGAARVGEARYQELVADYGAAAMDAVADAILDRSETAMRTAIRRLPWGEYSHEIMCDGYKQPTLIKARITIGDGTIEVDYAGSSPQRSDASVNCVSNNTHAHTLYAFKASLCADVPNNEGLFRPIRSTAPEGSILNPRFPAPVKARSKTSYHIHNAIFGALASVMPAAVQAGSGSFWSIKCHGVDHEGQPYAVHVLPNGGRGAVQGMDGSPTIAFPSNGTITPVEVLENWIPMLVLERSLRADSGGAGEFRGGLGQVIRITMLDEARLTITVRPDKMRFPAPGIAGGLPGAPGELLLDGAPMALEPTRLERGQVVTLRIPGGGGFGNPVLRDRVRLLADLDAGLVSAAAAHRLYDYDGEKLPT
jgi:N-methylhydantoinase B/oxoprolinase/acetone carboxylase alpha subunit